MMNDDLTRVQIDKLEESLNLLEAGLTLEDLLAQAGRDAEWLEPMLALAGEVEAIGTAVTVPPPDASLHRLLARGNALRREERLASRPVAPARPGFFQQRLQPLFRSGLSVALLAMVIAVICLIGGTAGGSLVLAAEDSLPGQTLYPVKRLGETIRLTLADDTADRQRLEDSFGTQRRQEVEQLLERNWMAEIAFASRVESFSETKVVVDCLEAQLTPETIITGELEIGAKVQIEGFTNADGQLTARAVTVLEEPLPTPAPTSTLLTPELPTATPVPALNATSDTLRIEITPSVAAPLNQPTPDKARTDDDRPGRNDRDDNRSDNSGPGSNNSGRGNGSDQNENNSGSGSNNSGPGNNNANQEDDEPDKQPAGDDQNDNRQDETPESNEDIFNFNDNSGSGSDSSGSNDNLDKGNSGPSDNFGSSNNSGSESSGSGKDDKGDDNSGKGGSEDD